MMLDPKSEQPREDVYDKAWKGLCSHLGKKNIPLKIAYFGAIRVVLTDCRHKCALRSAVFARLINASSTQTHTTHTHKPVEWQWNQLGHMQVCTLLQRDNHANTSPLSFLQAGCPSCRPTNSVKALKALTQTHANTIKYTTI